LYNEIARDEQVRHYARCPATNPPGDEIYRYDKLSVFEVNPSKDRVYTENLCLLAKLYLDHKNLFYETDQFLFYVLTEYTEDSYHFVGYYSKEKEYSKDKDPTKEKEQSRDFNLNCIFVLPCHQRKGYGKFLVNFSFELSLIEKKVGTPEVPLSDLGFQTYLSFWSQRLIEILLKHIEECKKKKGTSEEIKKELSIADISKETAIKQSDIIMVLGRLHILRYVPSQDQHVLFADEDYLKKIYDLAGRPAIPIKRECLHWTPFIYPGKKTDTST